MFQAKQRKHIFHYILFFLTNFFGLEPTHFNKKMVELVLEKNGLSKQFILQPSIKLIKYIPTESWIIFLLFWGMNIFYFCRILQQYGTSEIGAST